MRGALLAAQRIHQIPDILRTRDALRRQLISVGSSRSELDGAIPQQALIKSLFHIHRADIGDENLPDIFVQDARLKDNLSVGDTEELGIALPDGDKDGENQPTESKEPEIIPPRRTGFVDGSAIGHDVLDLSPHVHYVHVRFFDYTSTTSKWLDREAKETAKV